MKNLLNRKTMLKVGVLLLVASNLFGASDLTSTISSFIENEVLVWTRIAGVLTMLFGGVSVWINRSDQERLKQFLFVIVGGIAIFSIPEFINIAFSTFGSVDSIDALN